jgi:ferredoxin
MDDLEDLEDLANLVKKTSLCGLGKTAPNPVLTTLKYFQDEYIAHIKHNRCPALVCKDLIQYNIDPEECIGCGICKENCSAKAIEGDPKEPHRIKSNVCVKCGICFNSCPQEAIYKTTNPIEER